MSRFLTKPRWALGVGAVVALIGAAAVALAVGGCAGHSTRATAQQTPARRTRPLETIFEAQTELFQSPGPALDALKRLGVDRVKLFVPWSYLAPDPLSHTRPHFDATSPAAYPAGNWGIFDAIIREAAARRIGLDVALEAPAPLWATGAGVPPGTASYYLGAWEPSPKQFGMFVHAVATRYSGHYTPPGGGPPLPRVDFWSIWNEPNYGPQLAPQAVNTSTVEVSPALYRRLLDAAWSALQATGHQRDTVLIGELAPRGQTVGDQPGNFSGMVPLRFIRALYCVDGSFHRLSGTAATERSCPSTSAGSAAFAREHPGLFGAGGFAFHPYPQGFAPNVRTADEPDYADLPQLGPLERTLDGAMAAYGSHAQLPLYDTEFGYQTNPPETTIARAVPPAQAAAWANLAEWMSWRDPRVLSWDQYLLNDPPNGESNFDTGLNFHGGAHKALFDAFRMPVYLPSQTGKSGQAVEVWGCVRPLRYVHSRKPQVANIQWRPASGGRFKTVKRVILTDPHGYFDTRVAFPASGLVRISWSYPRSAGGGQIHSRTVQVEVR
jgi:hypothetical protein